jgi:hypothetical protein
MRRLLLLAALLVCAPSWAQLYGVQTIPGGAVMISSPAVASSGAVVDPTIAPRDSLTREYLAGNWHMSDATHIDVWYDTASGAKNATQTTYTNQPVASNGNELLFTGAANMTMPPMFALNNSSWSMVLRVRDTSDNGNYQLFLGKSGVSNFGVFGAVFYGYQFLPSTGSFTYKPEITTLVLNQEPGATQVVFSLWQDGALKATYTGAGAASQLNFDWVGYPGYPWNGTMVSIRQYSRPLTPAEVAAAPTWKDTL